jgi:CheY-like chemotaxis protein
MDEKHRILWVDDEIDLLKSQIIFLEGKQLQVTPAASGEEALGLLKNGDFDLVLLDQMMPGMDGLTCLAQLRRLRPDLPVVMATKSEREELMDQALGHRIDDFLLKPLNPTQVLASCRRVLEGRRLAEQQTIREYTGSSVDWRSADYGAFDWRRWCQHFRELTEWDLRLTQLRDPGLHESHEGILREANVEFGRFIEEAYPGWLHGRERPLLSVDLIERYVGPQLKASKKVLFLIIDCMRLDQWLTIEPIVRELFSIQTDYYFSVLPTATPYSRNAIFAGLFPAQIAANYPHLWDKSAASNEVGRNRYESQLLELNLSRLKQKLVPGPKYLKVSNADESREARRGFGSLQAVPLVSLVVNFMDILVHSRAESQILQEITPDEKATRALMAGWFVNSDVLSILKQAARQGRTVVLTTDHGSIQGRRGSAIQAGQDTSANLRYKSGSNISCDPRQVLWIKQPAAWQLPEEYRGMQYLIAKEDFYMVYPTRYEEYRRRYEGTFQHGGISLEEMILPVAVLNPR